MGGRGGKLLLALNGNCVGKAGMAVTVNGMPALIVAKVTVLCRAQVAKVRNTRYEAKRPDAAVISGLPVTDQADPFVELRP